MPLLTWNSFPVLVLTGLAVWEALPFFRQSLRASRWWRLLAWFWRPWGLWAVLNIVFRLLGRWGFGDRTTFPFFCNPWRSGSGWRATFDWLFARQELATWSLVLFLLGLLFLLTCRQIIAAPPTRRTTALVLVVLVAFAFVLPLTYECLPEGPGNLDDSEGCFLQVWLDSGSTMLYCMPRVHSKAHFLKHFDEIQPTLRVSIHGVSHPPGATLALYWLGKCFGATEQVTDDRLRYALGSTLFAALGVIAVFLLGWTMYQSRQAGLMAAALWAVKPAALAYNTFSPDAVCTVFFILFVALTWRIALADRRRWGSMIALGVVLYALTLLNFIWPLFVALFGFMVLLFAWRLDLRPADWIVRGAVPVALMALLLVTTCFYYRLNYVAVFHYALTYYNGCHRTDLYQKVMETVGGQVDLYLMTGSFCVYLFWTRLPGWLRCKPVPPQALFLLAILAFQIVTIVFLKGPAGEASRIWAWIPAVPVAMVANHLRTLDRPGFYFTAAAAFALLQYYFMRLFLMFLG